MNGRISKSLARRSSLKLSQASHERLADAITTTDAELPQTHKGQSPSAGDLAQDASVQSTKRHLDGLSAVDQVSVKRARLRGTNAQQPEAEYEEAEQAGKILQPKPGPPKHPHALFVEDAIDPVFPDPSPESICTSVHEWLESVGTDDDPVSRELTRSGSEMDQTRDNDGFAIPQKPYSAGSNPHPADAYAGSVTPSDHSGRSSGRSLVEDPSYRHVNLKENHVTLRHPFEAFPEHIMDLLDTVRKERDSPGPSPDQLKQDVKLVRLEMGAEETQVEDYFRATVFPDPDPAEGLKRVYSQPMSRNAVPSTGSRFRLSTPVPDMAYGYEGPEAFPKQLTKLKSVLPEAMVNNAGLYLPFFVIEFKGDNYSGAGSLCVATNQCLGASTTCVNIAERFNSQLMHYKSEEIRPIDSAAFSIAMNGTEARLYTSWKHDKLDYYMQKFGTYRLQVLEDHLEFRKHVRNIVDWGKGKRLDMIRDSLDCLPEEDRQTVSEVASGRGPPSDVSATSSGKRRRSSSSRGRGRGSKSTREP